MKIIFKVLGVVWSISFLSFIALLMYSLRGGELPIEAKNYINYFQSFLTSHWFFVFFVFMWFGGSFYMARTSGWQTLALKYTDNGSKRPLKFHTGNGYIGEVRHNGILRVAADEKGFYLRVLLPFKFGHKNLFISWCEVSAVRLEDGLFAKNTPHFIRGVSKAFLSRKCLAITLKKYPEQIITLQGVEDFVDYLPESLKGGI
ncbi:hypothetical protein L2750_07585 [Shewanella submarina]|uniref:Uncharacterized protein n=1 Tax=Shewanella submarina TaxID=2016376 RepID=A0ABV7G7V2_9GAMM|nr:hypothetical protein [Shewanella submarina]MCL1037012.1 hypothetical protein [Shewanella submarina]